MSYRTRQLAINNRKLLQGSKIVIREDLSKDRLQLLKSATTRFGFRNVWTRDGNICVRLGNKRHTITTQEELQKIK